MIRSWSKLMILPASSMSRYDLERDISTRKNRPTYPQKRPTYPQKRSTRSYLDILEAEIGRAHV